MQLRGHARVTGPPSASAYVGSAPMTLSRTDLHSIGLRLKTIAPVFPARTRAYEKAGGRSLPLFLMRHRAALAASTVGHTRAQAAVRRGGAHTAVAGVGLSALALLFLGLLLGGAGAVAGAAYYVGKLPSVDKPQYALTVQTSKIFDRNGTPLYDMVDDQTGRRSVLSIDEISPLVVSATVATEDANFFTNSGVDLVGIVRAVTINVSGDGQSGASTITQQVVRQTILSPEERTQRTFTRKIKEAVLAVEMTRSYSKLQIMQMYLNQNYYGHRAYGIGAAALSYFGKPAKDLTLPEAALLAGLPQAPSDYDPLVHPDQAKRRQAIVLDLMVKQGMISQQQANQAKGQPLVLKPYQPVLQAPHFVNYVIDYLEKKYGPDIGDSGLRVYTSLDLRVQQAAEKVAKDRINELKAQNATNAAIVIMKPGTGEILAMVGSVDYYNTAIDGQVNVATSQRQPGSSFKPITYVTAFSKGWTPGTAIHDSSTAFLVPGQKPYIPHNYDKKFHGWVTARQALANSYNIPAVKTLQFAGIQNVINIAHAMGIKGLNRGLDWYGLSLTLGGGEVTLLDMTNAYSTFANTGQEIDANPILKIEDAQGNVIYQADPATQRKPVLDPRIAYMITSILSDNRARTPMFGSSSPLKTSFPSAAKTGTTDDNRDSWTLGYTPDLTVGVWVGNSNNAQMSNVTGAIGAAVIWHNMMETFYSHPEFVDLVRQPDGTVQTNFQRPPGLVQTYACSAAGEVHDLFFANAIPRGCTTYRDSNPAARGNQVVSPTPQRRKP